MIENIPHNFGFTALYNRQIYLEPFEKQTNIVLFFFCCCCFFFFFFFCFFFFICKFGGQKQLKFRYALPVNIMLVIGDFHNIGFYLYHVMSIGQSRLTASSGLIRNIAGYHFAYITATNPSPSAHIQMGQNFLFLVFENKT